MCEASCFGLYWLRYCFNNPLIYTDPSGNKAEWWHVAGAFLSMASWSSIFNSLQGESYTVGKFAGEYIVNGAVMLAGFQGGGPIAQFDYLSAQGIKTVANSVIPWPNVTVPVGNNGYVNLSTGLGLGNNGFILAGNVSYTYVDGDNAYTLGVGGGTNHWSWGASASFNDGGFGVGYHRTYYGDAVGPDGVSNNQIVGGLTISSHQFAFRIENDFLGDKHDRWRSNAVELGFWGGDVVVGTTLYNNDPATANPNGWKKSILSPIWGKNKHGNGGWINGLTYTSPLYIGFKSNNNISRIGYSHHSFQDATQNGVHKNGFLGLPFGYQHYYANYSRFSYGPYSYQGYFNPFSLWGR